MFCNKSKSYDWIKILNLINESKGQTFRAQTYRERINQIADNRFRQHIQNRQHRRNKAHHIWRNAQLLSKHIDLWQNRSHCCQTLKQNSFQFKFKCAAKSAYEELTCHKKEEMCLDRQQAIVNFCHLIIAALLASSAVLTAVLNAVLTAYLSDLSLNF